MSQNQNQIAPSRLDLALSVGYKDYHSLPAWRIDRAIDAGFGMIKFSRAAVEGEEGVINGVVMDSFPSIAIEVKKGLAGVNNGRQRDTVMVACDGKTFEAGKDIRRAMSTNDFGRNMTDGYYESTVYHALMLTALTYMGEPYIDTLVLGLPMNHFKDQARVDALMKRYTGCVDLGMGRCVYVGRVAVEAQPMGGFLGLKRNLDGINKAIESYPKAGLQPLMSEVDLHNLNILVVDFGQFTLDWLHLIEGSVNEKLSHAKGDAGRHRTLSDVHTYLSALLGKPLGADYFNDIDKGLRTTRKLRFKGEVIDLDAPEIQAVIENSVNDPVNEMFAYLRGEEERLDLVIVLGGSPVEVANAIRKSYSYLPLYCAEDATGQMSSMFSNLRGFQELAEAMPI